MGPSGPAGDPGPAGVKGERGIKGETGDILTVKVKMILFYLPIRLFGVKGRI